MCFPLSLDHSDQIGATLVTYIYRFNVTIASTIHSFSRWPANSCHHAMDNSGGINSYWISLRNDGPHFTNGNGVVPETFGLLIILMLGGKVWGTMPLVGGCFLCGLGWGIGLQWNSHSKANGFKELTDSMLTYVTTGSKLKIPNIRGNIKTNHDSAVHHQTQLNKVGASEKILMHGQVAEHVKSCDSNE